ncbi:hypothetical protein [Xenorhabdus bovienii]|uniref:DUF7823 domain-containing protein n=1 Tax=Xenorhabdus bovienii TaxID=40576 RepID=UPI0004D60F10|nr:hypothetical protein [Xenorhabdus bovienii]CDG89790.1 conserved hypothetical protein [Xenorhabdus bovienii str. feltiae France]CDG91763.1 conserved hypothetical protein [Xenorhabdus bovienii str. feltiae Florida]
MSEVNKPGVIPSEDMLIIDVTLYVGQYEGGTGTKWGYSNEAASGDNPAFGSLTVVQNTTDIAKISSFYWGEYSYENLSGQSFVFDVFSHVNEGSRQNVIDLFQHKNLYIAVDNLNYNPDFPTIDGIQPKPTDRYQFFNWYEGTEVQRLSSVLKRSGETKRFYINWLDDE